MRFDFYKAATTKPEAPAAPPAAQVAVQSIEFSTPANNPATLSYLLGGAARSLAVKLLPANATNQKVTWSVDVAGKVTITPTGPSTATVAATGAVDQDQVVITATSEDGGKQATCTVTFTSAPILATGIFFDPATISFHPGGTPTLTPHFGTGVGFDQNPQPTDTQVVWTGGDGNVTIDSPSLGVPAASATLSATGNTTAPVAITATTNDGSNHSASISVTVTTPVQSIDFNPGTTLTLSPGGSPSQVTVEISPPTASVQIVGWAKTESNSVINLSATQTTINHTITVTPTSNVGTATITATLVDTSVAPSFTYTATLNVEVGTPVSNIVSSSSTAGLFVGESTLLTATVNPTNASDTSVSWASNPPGIVSVVPVVPGVGNGVATATLTSLAVGTTTVTVTTTEGSHPATTVVTVFPSAVPSPLGGGALPASTGGAYSGATLAVDSSTSPSTPYVAFRDSTGNGIVQKFSGGSWVQVGSAFGSNLIIDPPSPTAPLSQNIGLVVDQGIPYVAYLDGLNGGAAKVLAYSGGNWITYGPNSPAAGSASAGAATYLSLTLDPAHQPFLGLVDAGASGAASAMHFNGNDWTPLGGTQGFNAANNGPGTTFTTVAVDPLGWSPNDFSHYYIVLRSGSSTSREDFYHFPGNSPTSFATTSNISPLFLTAVTSPRGRMFVGGTVNGTAGQYFFENPINNRNFFSMAGTADYVGFAVDSRNDISYLAYRDSSHLVNLTKLADPVGGGVATTVMSDLSGGVPVYGVKLAMDHAGVLYLMYESGNASGGDITVKQFDR